MSGLLKMNRMSLIGGFCAWGFFLLAGCDPAPTTPKDPVKTAKAKDAHDKHDGHDHDEHGHGAPHKGQLVEIEGEAGHIELVLDAETGKLTAYILDGAAKGAVSVPNKELNLTFSTQKGLTDKYEELKLDAVDAKDGKATTFAGTSPKLKGVKEFSGAIAALKVGDKEFKAIEVKYPSPHQH